MIGRSSLMLEIGVSAVDLPEPCSPGDCEQDFDDSSEEEIYEPIFDGRGLVLASGRKTRRIVRSRVLMKMSAYEESQTWNSKLCWNFLLWNLMAKNARNFLHGGATTTLVDLVGSVVIFTVGPPQTGVSVEINFFIFGCCLCQCGYYEQNSLLLYIPDGDIIDCVPMSSQPTFDHPYLKDYKSQVSAWPFEWEATLGGNNPAFGGLVQAR
ncbi:hypothetical protein LINPERPRIM_LOCUS36424 [Linum perenne]